MQCERRAREAQAEGGGVGGGENSPPSSNHHFPLARPAAPSRHIEKTVWAS